jgi:hypothetical protein
MLEASTATNARRNRAPRREQFLVGRRVPRKDSALISRQSGIGDRVSIGEAGKLLSLTRKLGLGKHFSCEVVSASENCFHKPASYCFKEFFGCFRRRIGVAVKGAGYAPGGQASSISPDTCRFTSGIVANRSEWHVLFLGISNSFEPGLRVELAHRIVRSGARALAYRASERRSRSLASDRHLNRSDCALTQ